MYFALSSLAAKEWLYVRSHGQGTAAMLHEGETQGALAGVALALAAVFTSVVAPLLIPWLVRVGS